MIPVFRAKKIDSDEYIIGYLEEHNTNDFYISLMPNEIDSYKIDTSTLSIHFPDMVDSNGNKIFASLSKDGKGGDIISLEHIIKTVIWCKKTQAIMLNSKSTGLSILSLYKEDIEVIGIQE